MVDELSVYLDWVNTLCGASVHVDVMRPDFVETNYISMEEYVFIMDKCKLPMDVHLMTKDFDEFIEKANKNVRSITIHVEAGTASVIERTLKKIKKAGFRAGLAIDAPSKITDNRMDLLALADVLTIMSIKAGASGREADIYLALERVKKFKPMEKPIIIDGGVNTENISQYKAAKVNTVVVGSALFNSINRLQYFDELCYNAKL